MSLDIAVFVFSKVKPKCVQLAQITLSDENRSGTLELVNALKDLHETLKTNVNHLIKEYGGDNIFLPLNLSDYIMVPITKILKNDSTTDSELEHILGIILLLLKYSFCTPGCLSTDLFTQYVTLLTFIIGGKPGNFAINSHSDETYTNGLLCIDALIEGAILKDSYYVTSILDNIKFIPTLGYLVSTLLSIAVESPIANVQRQSLYTLNKLFHLLNDGEILSLFFPGTVSSIAKIIKLKARSIVVEECFRALSTIVNLIFSDYDLGVEMNKQKLTLEAFKLAIDEEDEEDENSQLDIDIELQDPKGGFIKIPGNIDGKKKHRTTSWLNSTLVQFGKGLAIILNINYDRYSKPSVKDAIYQFDVKFVRNCFISCQPLLPLVLRSLSELCAADSSFLQNSIDSLTFLTELETLRRLVHQLLTKELEMMQYNFMSPDSSKTESMLANIYFLLCILNSSGGVDAIIIESLILQLIDNLTYLCMAKNAKNSKSLFQTEKHPTIEGQLKIISSQYDRTKIEDAHHVELFNGVITRKTEVIFLDVLKALSQNIDQIPETGFVFTDNISGNLKQSIHVWMISNIAEGMSKNKHLGIDDFLSFDSNDNNGEEKPLANCEFETEAVLHNNTYNALEVSINTLKCCSNSPDELYTTSVTAIMCLRTINNSMKILKEDFEDELIDVVYPVVECLASSNETIRTEAQIVTMNIASLFYDGSIEKVFLENSDYLLDALSSKLTGESLTPKIPILLSVFVKLGSMDIVTQLDDIVRTIFTLLDAYNNYSMLCEGFFLVFNEIITKIYQDLTNFNLDDLATRLEDDDVMNFGIWGLKSADEVEKFVEKQAISFIDLLGDSDDEDDDETLKKDKKLEIDSDDSDSEGDVKSISSYAESDINNDNNDDSNKWISPLTPKLYNTLTNILSYAERLLQTNHTSLAITLLKTIHRIIPLLATQNTKFLLHAVSIWEIVAFFINNNNDLRIVNLCIEILKELIKYGNTFFTSRFIEIYKETSSNFFLKSIIYKQKEIMEKKNRIKDTSRKVFIDRTSTSTNWEMKTFNEICRLFIFALQKFGRFVPYDVATSIIQITIHYDSNCQSYGFFDSLAFFLSTKFLK